MKKIIFTIVCLGMALSVYAQRVPSSESVANTGNSVFSVDSKHINKLMFTYNPGEIFIPDGYSTDDSDTTFFSLGYTSLGLTYTHSIAVASFPLYVEFGGGLQYMFKADEKFKSVSAYIPVNLLYRFSFLDGKMHISPYTGVYCRYNFFAKADDEYLLGKGSYLKRAQLGWQIGASFEIKKFYVHFAYNTDISSVFQEGMGRFRGLNIGLGVIF